jgi:hypothetical protein
VKRLRHIPWYLVGGLVLGFALGLVYAWLISPVQYVDSTPDALQADFKDQYRLLIASAFQVDGDLARASTRLAWLGDPQPAPALTAQASRLLEAGDPQGSAYTLLLLAQALQPVTPVVATEMASTTPTMIISPTTMPPSDTPSITDTPGGPLTETPSVTNTPAMTDTPTTTDTPAPPTATLFLSPTPRPTRTPVPTPGEPYVLTSQDAICNANQLGVLIQIQVRNAAGEPVPGEDIIVSWAGGREHIFTGLKPELGNGYADFGMTPGILYSVQIASGGVSVTDLEAPSCESGGATWWGSILLTFQQP